MSTTVPPQGLGAITITLLVALETAQLDIVRIRALP